MTQLGAYVPALAAYYSRQHFFSLLKCQNFCGLFQTTTTVFDKHCEDAGLKSRRRSPCFSPECILVTAYSDMQS